MTIPAAAHRAFQTSTVSALLDGAYEGDVSFAELAGAGDFGLGTLNGCDGEMIAIDGRFLHADVEGRVEEVSPEAQTPFAVLTRFEPRHRFELQGGARLRRAVRRDRPPGRAPGDRPRAPHRRALRPRALPLGPQAAQALPAAGRGAGRAVDLRLHDVAGTLLGFRFPDLGLGVGVAGYHLHFVRMTAALGGHVLDCRPGGRPRHAAGRRPRRPIRRDPARCRDRQQG